MRRPLQIALACTITLAGCAVIKSTDVTDASYKRHQSVSICGWPVYTRITDRENSSPAQLATKFGEVDKPNEIRAAELLGRPIDPDLQSLENP